MRALVLEGDVGIENVKLVERPTIEPGAGQIRVRMKTVSLNYRDLATIQSPQQRERLPFALLSDGAGVVEAVGPGVTRMSVGDRVTSLFFPNWLAGDPTPPAIAATLGGGTDGVAQEQLIFGAESVSKFPDALTDAEAACLPCAALTAWRALFVEAALKPGDTVLVQGTGGVSLFALQFAKAAGATVIITSSSDEKLARAKSLGADHLINYRSEPEWGRAARKLAGGRGVDHVVEVGGSGTLQQSLQAARIGGSVAVIGMLAGVGDVPFFPIFRSGARIRGISVGSRDHYEAMCRAVEVGGVRPVIDQVFPVSEAQDAFRRMRAGDHFGKIVLEF